MVRNLDIAIRISWVLLCLLTTLTPTTLWPKGLSTLLDQAPIQSSLHLVCKTPAIATLNHYYEHG